MKIILNRWETYYWHQQSWRLGFWKGFSWSFSSQISPGVDWTKASSSSWGGINSKLFNS